MKDEKLQEDEPPSVVTTEGGGMRLRSSFEISVDESGSIEISINGPTIDFIDCN